MQSGNDLGVWPTPVVEYLRTTYGPVVAVERLGGMSAAQVARVRFAETSVIVKGNAGEREARFYTRVAPGLRPAGIPVPELEWSTPAGEAHWLILEDIPAPLPTPLGGIGQPDPRAVTILARLHALELDAPAEPSVRDEWHWTDAMTDAALACVPPAAARTLAPRLRRLQRAAQHLIEPWCWISGDPHPSNWGVRLDGGLVLFDWEQFGRGTPPVDLAILVAGLGNPSTYAQLAAAYLDRWRTITAVPPWPPGTLARDIALAKAWSVVSFLGRTAPDEGTAPAERHAPQVEEMAAWLAGLEP